MHARVGFAATLLKISTYVLCAILYAAYRVPANATNVIQLISSPTISISLSKAMTAVSALSIEGPLCTTEENILQWFSMQSHPAAHLVLEVCEDGLMFSLDSLGIFA